MQELRLYDPNRRPPDWKDIIRRGQYAVFHSDLATDVEKRPNGRFLAPGEESACLVFDTLSEAEAYCEAKVAEVPSLRCDIYDHLGKGKPPAMTYVNQAHLKAPRKHARWGWLLIAGSVVCFWIDWHWNWVLILPTVIGINMIFAGLRLIYWSGGAKGKRARRTV
jgi:hypothetical protein